MFVRATDLASPESASAARHAHSDFIPCGLTAGLGFTCNFIGAGDRKIPHTLMDSRAAEDRLKTPLSH
jgi:hypothetical protein